MKVFKILGFAVFTIVLITLYVFVMMQLWNWLMPSIFGITTLTFWQTLGILLLFKLLFLGGGWGCRRHCGPRHSHRHHWKSKFRQKWEEKCEEKCNAQKDDNEQ